MGTVIHPTIWSDQDFRALTIPEQHLYFVLATHSKLDKCGAGPWFPGRISTMADGWNRADLHATANSLLDKKYIAIDQNTDEFLVRSYIRHRGSIAGQSNCIGVRNSYKNINSGLLRGVVMGELRRLKVEFPDAKGWPALAETMDSAPESYPQKLSTSTVDNFLDPYLDPYLDPSATPSKPPEKRVPMLCPSTSNEVGVESKDQERTRSARLSATTLPDNWEPPVDVVCSIRDRFPEVDLELATEKFRNYWQAKSGRDSTKKDWIATWRNWIINESQYMKRNNSQFQNRSGTERATDILAMTQRLANTNPEQLKLESAS